MVSFLVKNRISMEVQVANGTIRTVLSVDNSPVFTTFMQEALESEGYTVITAESGIEALEVLDRRRPDLIFLDRVMPEIDGDTLCRLLRARPDTANLPIVLLSAIAAEDQHDPVLKIADACLAKTAFSALRPAILQVVKDIEAGRLAEYRGRVVGSELLHGREVTRELLDSKHRLQTFLETSPNGVVQLNSSGVITIANETAHRLLGHGDRSVISTDIRKILPTAELRDRVETALGRLSSEPQKLGEDGSVEIHGRTLVLTLVAIESAIAGSALMVMQDITAIHEARTRAELLLHEKEQLLREIQHRVKNNLSMISGLLQLQARRGTSSEVTEALQEADGRVRSVLKLYDILFQTGSSQQVSIGSFLTELCRELSSVFDGSVGSVGSVAKIQCHVPETDLGVSAETAMAVGLIVNELITNAFKHAFEFGSQGAVTVQLVCEPGGTAILEVSDNGIGMPEEIELDADVGFGLELVRAQVEQLNGELEIERAGGTRFRVRFSMADAGSP